MPNGKHFLLGRENLADAVSTLVKNGVGPALRLLVDSGPPLALDSQEMVENLNADMLDGKHDYELTGVGHVRIEGDPPLLPVIPEILTYGRLTTEPPAPGYIRLTGNVTFFHDLSNITEPQPWEVPGSGLVRGGLRIVPFVGGPTSDSILSFEDIKGRQYANLALDGLFPVAPGDTHVEIMLSRGSEGPGVGPIYAQSAALTAQYSPYEIAW